MQCSRSISQVTIVVFMFFMLASTPLLAGARPANNGGPGNSGAAKMCQHDGWRTLAPGFSSQGECVSYGAQGGALEYLTGIVVPAGASVTFDSRLNAVNALEGTWYASDGTNGLLCSKPMRYQYEICTSTTTVGPFSNGVVLTLLLTDVYCQVSFDHYSNHASVTPTDSGYEVRITDAGEDYAYDGCRYADVDRAPNGTEFDNFIVSIAIN